MKYYLLSDQDLDEILWDIEYLMWQIKEKVKEKFINESGNDKYYEVEGD